jgi:outer membrane protein OmpA-like peptidoglycan-associated protein
VALVRLVRQTGRSRDEAEKPFWISYADLMTALMVLFLVVMSVAILAVTKTLSQQEQEKLDHQRAIDTFLDSVEKVTSTYSGIRVDRARRVIDFQDRARFSTNVYKLQPEQAGLLREFVPSLLKVATTDLGKRILKRVVVEGFADQSGTYLYNLNLSLQRSQAVLCALFATPAAEEVPLSTAQLTDIRDLFVVGGYSFNDARRTAAESRRVELRLELYALGDDRQPTATVPANDFGTCGLGH